MAIVMVSVGSCLGVPVNSMLDAQGQTPQRFIPVFTWYYYDITTSEQEAALSRYNFSDVTRSSHKDHLGRNTWEVIRSLNPAHEIYLYEFSYGPYDFQDRYSAVDLNTISRWNDSRGHSMGNLNKDHPEFFLLDSKGGRIRDSYGVWVMDIGLQAYVDYWVEAVMADIIKMPWKADGVYVDGPSFLLPQFSAVPVKYPTTEKWSSAAISFIRGVTSALKKKDVKVWFNVGETRSLRGQANWTFLDSLDDRPDILMEEGMFATRYNNYFVAFCPEDACKNAIDTMQSIKKIRVAMSSNVNALPGDTGIDNFGKQVTYWDALYFALTCFLLGKNTVDNNSYFSWHDNSKTVVWVDEFSINLGNAVGNYQVTKYGAVNVYWREYQSGYVYVNLSDRDLSGINLPGPCRRVTHDNVLNPFEDSIIPTLDLPAHRGAILIKPSVTSWRSIQLPAGMRAVPQTL